MADVLINADLIAKTALMDLENNCVLGNLFYREYENEWKGIKHGDAVRIRKPVKFVAGNTMAVIAEATTAGTGSRVQSVKESYITLTLNQWRNVTWDFDVKQLSLNIEEYNKRYIQPAVIQLVNEIEMSCAGLYKDIYNTSSIADTISATGSSTGFHGKACPRSFRDVGQGAKELNINACPPEYRSFAMDPDAQLELSANFTSLSIPNIAGPALRTGKPGVIANMPIYMGQQILKHTAGALCGSSNGTTLGHTITAATTSVFGSTVLGKIEIQTSGSTLGLSKGDIFWVNNVYSVNPVGKQSNRVLQKFTVAADVTGVAVNTTMDVFCYPAMEVGTTSTTGGTTGANPYKNVTEYPSTTDTQVSFLADHTANLAFHKNAFALAMAKLDVPSSADFAATKNHNGFAIAVTKGFDILGFTEVIRLDVLYGVLTLYPELACRVIGSTT